LFCAASLASSNASLFNERREPATFESARQSVGAGVRPRICCVIRAAKAVAVKAAASETTPSIAKVISAHARHVTSAEATYMTSAESTHVTSAKAASVASATSMSSASATAGLCTRGKKAAGKHGTCQNHHQSSSHDIVLWDGRDFPPQGCSRTLACPNKANADVAMD
jgi:hypothetical protein